MTEPIHHDADDGFHEIQLSGKQLVFLFMAGTTAAVMIFLCGVWVGRGVPNDRGIASESHETAAATAPSAATPSQPVASSSGPPAAEPPAPAEDELSYAKRLQAESTPAEKLKPQSSAPQAAPRDAAPKPQPAPPQPKPEPAAPQMTARPGAWIVQVVSLQDRSAAAAIAKRLSGKGYPAFVLDPAAGGPRIYRVQVGAFTDKTEAEQASRRLERDEQFKPFVRAR